MPTIGQTIAQDLNHRCALPIANLAAGLHTDVLSLAGILLDPAYDLGGSMNAGTLNADLANPLNYASCYPTAEHLFPVLAQAGQPVAHGANLNNYPSGNALRAQVAGLVNQMQTANGAGADGVYRIEFAGHGFTIVMRTAGAGMQAELIESLAHSAPITRSLGFGPAAPAAVIQNLQDMASDDLNTRVAGAASMGWNAHALYLGQDPQHGGHIDFPAVRFKWWATNLSPNWAAQWGVIFQTRFNLLAASIPIPDRI
jgi:hypothetical protein